MKERDTEKQLKALEEAVRQEQETGGKTAKKHRESSSAAAKESHPLASFLIGLVLLGAGIFWVVTAIGLLAILVTLLTSVRFRPVSASLWQYVVMFGMIAAGCGLVARGLLKSRD